jgi:tRNA-specific 2-thiouridylase
VHGAHTPHFVKSIDAKHNTITVCHKENLVVKEVFIDTLNMFIDDREFEATVKLRYRSYPCKCKVTINDELKSAKIELKDKIFGVACGQIAVFYDKDKLIGSGVIISTN